MTIETIIMKALSRSEEVICPECGSNLLAGMMSWQWQKDALFCTGENCKYRVALIIFENDNRGKKWQ
jgi:hypothetical protein